MDSREQLSGFHRSDNFNIESIVITMSTNLANEEYWEENWEENWEDFKIPLEINRKKEYQPHDILSDILPDKELSLLEIGCAPGGWLAIFHRNFNLSVSGVDYVERACKKTEENLKILEIAANIYHADVFKFRHEPYDIIFSMGFIEHFTHFDPIMNKINELCTKNSGIVITVIPNLQGLNWWIRRTFRPKAAALRRVISFSQLIEIHEEIGFKTIYANFGRPLYIMPPLYLTKFWRQYPRMSLLLNSPVYVLNYITDLLCRWLKFYPKIGFINISTSSVYGFDATGDESTEPKPTSYYGVIKLAAEQLVLASNRDQGFPACSLRLFSVYGPRERPEKLYPKLIKSILEDKDLTLYEESEKHLRSYTYIDDIIQGLIAPLDNFDVCLGEIFNIGTDAAITTGDGIKIVEEIVGKKVRITKVPKRSGDQLRTHANIDKARRILAFAPKISAQEGLKKEVDWYKEQILGKINLWPD
jgi:2-polyprenyl-3-methyl-5-hydroxy-6-metoxy-1,4-benzoquinol methylase